MRIILLFSILAVSAGCTNLALKRATLSHADSTMDLRYREVIENLAMTASELDPLPAYSSIFAGTTDINDIGRATSTSLWARTAMKPFRFNTFFSQQTADFFGSRAFKSNWTLDPTVVPEKLRAMRAAYRWVTFGEENVGPDIACLNAYEPPRYKDTGDKYVLERLGSENGYYFNVADRLRGLPTGWFHFANRRLQVPKGASCWPCGGGKFIWVGPEEMSALSQFTLIIQEIARVDLDSVYHPKTRTRMIKKDFEYTELGRSRIGRATIYLDENGVLTSAADTAAIPRKMRTDNVGSNSDLKSIINASAKSPQ
jgi:hypothetical protein